MDNNSYIKPLRPSREIKIVISVCFLLARLCDRGGCVFVRGCGAVTFSGASRCPLRYRRARPGPPRARLVPAGPRPPGEPAGRAGTDRGRENVLGAGGAARPRRRSRSGPRSAPPLPAKVAGTPRGSIGPSEARRGHHGPAEPAGTRGTEAPRRHASPRDRPVVSGRGGSASPGDTGGHLRGPSPREGSRAPSPRASPHACPRSGRGCGARGAPGAAGPHGGGCTGLTPGRVRPRSTCPGEGASRSGMAPLPAAARGARGGPAGSHGHECAPREPLHEHGVRGAARTALPERPRGRARLPAPGGESAATCPGPCPLPPPPAVPGRAPHGRRDPRAARPGLPRRARAPRAVPGVGAAAPRARGTARRGAAWSPPERPSRRASSGGTLRPSPLPTGRGSRTCPAGCAAPRQPRGAVLSHAWGGSRAARAPSPRRRARPPPAPSPPRSPAGLRQSPGPAADGQPGPGGAASLTSRSGICTVAVPPLSVCRAGGGSCRSPSPARLQRGPARPLPAAGWSCRRWASTSSRWRASRRSGSERCGGRRRRGAAGPGGAGGGGSR